MICRTSLRDSHFQKRSQCHRLVRWMFTSGTKVTLATNQLNSDTGLALYRSTVTAITKGAVASSPLTNSIDLIVASLLGSIDKYLNC
jgi:phage-related tail protein